MRRLALGIVCLGLAALYFGCAEMPELADDARMKSPRLAGSSYTILEEEGMPEMLYFRSDYPCVSGIRSAGRVERHGRRATSHVIDLGLMRKNPKNEYTLLLDDFTAATFHRVPPTENGAVTIGFLGGGRDRTERLENAAEVCASYAPHAVVVTGNAFPLDRQLKSWDQFFFKPLKKLTLNTPMVFLPEDRALMPAEAAAALRRPFWGRDLGCVRLLFLSMDALKNPASRAEALNWLRDDLANNSRPWRVLCLAEPVFGAQKIHARVVETFGTLLENGGVDLVISGGAGYYLRTLPIKSGQNKPVRYVVTGGLDADAKPTLGREYKAALFMEPHVGMLTATPERLAWNVYALAESTKRLPLDTLEITAGSDANIANGEPLIEKNDILTDALASLTLQREVVAIARQAAKAVPDLKAKRQIYNFVLNNTTSQEIKGHLVWTQASETAWKVHPRAMEFQLQPGFSGTAKFVMERYIDVESAPMPELTASIDGVGAASQPMLIAQRKEREIFHRLDAGTPITVDGQMVENDWEKAAVFTDFVVLGGSVPRQNLEMRACYDSRGMYFLVRAAANRPAAMPCSAKAHDDPVHHDESVEFFFDPMGAGRDFFQFAVNVQGVKLDRSSAQGLSWNPHWEAKVTKHEDYYVVEAFIPFTALGLTRPPKPGSRWGFDMFRNDYGNAAGRGALPEKRTPAADGKNTVNSSNIEEIAMRDLGRKAVEEATGENKKESAPRIEVVQWADTFGSNARSGCYGDLVFRAAASPAGKLPKKDSGKKSGK